MSVMFEELIFVCCVLPPALILGTETLIELRIFIGGRVMLCTRLPCSATLVKKNVKLISD